MRLLIISLLLISCTEKAVNPAPGATKYNLFNSLTGEYMFSVEGYCQPASRPSSSDDFVMYCIGASAEARYRLNIQVIKETEK